MSWNEAQALAVQASPPTGMAEQSSTLQTPLLPSSSGLRQRAQPGDVEEGPEVPGESDGSRILDRGADFYQSRGRWGVERLPRGRLPRRRHCCGWLSRFWTEWVLGDWFHRLAYKRTCVLMMILFLIYTSIVVFFGFVYLGASVLGEQTEINPDGTKKIIAFCDMDINDHMEALYFSLSTMTTIGYGVSDYYFGGCWTPLLLVLWQVCSAITFDAVAVGLLFHRISRGRKRGKTILFSNKAVVQRIRGIPHLMFRIGELRQYHLIEASVRCYCVRHERRLVASGRNETAPGIEEQTSSSNEQIETTYFVSRQVKLLHPDENYGSHIWMGLPQVVVHRLDQTSPLFPGPIWYDANGVAHDLQQTRESAGEDPPSAPGLELPPRRASTQDITQFLTDRDVEIVILVEGTDEGTGAATQARHSYKVSDLAWNHSFSPCIHPYSDLQRRRRRRDGSPACTIDFSRFHDIRPTDEDCESSPYVPQQH